MRSKFSSLLLTGKAAALPLLMNNAQALTPLFSDVVSANLTQVQLPVAKQIVLDSLGDSVYQNARKAPAFRPGMNSACSKAAHRFLNWI